MACTNLHGVFFPWGITPGSERSDMMGRVPSGRQIVRYTFTRVGRRMPLCNAGLIKSGACCGADVDASDEVHKVAVVTENCFSDCHLGSS